MAFPNDMSRICESLAGASASNPNFIAASSKSARCLIRRSYKLYKPAADGAAGTATVYATGDVMRVRSATRVIGVYMIPTVAITADAANQASINLVSADGLGGAAVVVATLLTNLAQGNLVAGVVYTMAIVVAANRLTLGQILGITITKPGTGVIVPVATFIVDVEEEDVDGYPV